MAAKFYLYNFNGTVKLYGKKGYEFFHFIWKKSYFCNEFNLDGPRILYEFIDYGWREITSAQATEVLRDMWPKSTAYIWAYEAAQKEKALKMIQEA